MAARHWLVRRRDLLISLASVGLTSLGLTVAEWRTELGLADEPALVRIARAYLRQVGDGPDRLSELKRWLAAAEVGDAAAARAEAELITLAALG